MENVVIKKIITFLFFVGSIAIGTSGAEKVGQYLATDSDKRASELLFRRAVLDARDTLTIPVYLFIYRKSQQG